MQGMFLSKTHGSVNLMAHRRDLSGGFAATRLGDRNGKIIVAKALRFEQGIGRRGGRRKMARSNGEHMLDGLKFSDRTTELDPLVGIGQSVVQATLHAPDHLLNPDRRS